MNQAIKKPQVLFHQFKKKSGRDLLVYACRLVEKGYKQGTSSIYIHCNNEEEANEIDALLWTFRQESFVPHSLISKKKWITNRDWLARKSGWQCQSDNKS